MRIPGAIIGTSLVVAPAAKPDTKAAAAWIVVPARPDAPPPLMQAVNHAD
jgi:hypothetical protein